MTTPKRTLWMVAFTNGTGSKGGVLERVAAYSAEDAEVVATETIGPDYTITHVLPAKGGPTDG